MNFYSLEQIFCILFLSASRARKNECPNGGRALFQGESWGCECVDPVQKSVFSGSLPQMEGEEPGVELGRGTTKLDLGQGGRNQDL